MNVLTALVLTAMAAWVAAMLGGAAPTDFSLFLFVAMLVSGAYYAAERFHLAPRRHRDAEEQMAQLERLGGAADGAPSAERRALEEQLRARPWWLEYTAGFFPVIALVFGLRSFVFEPFRIPSGSMIPTLQVGDLILVNKYQYGIRLPIVNRTLIEVGHPQRGDVMVFRYPHDTSQDYIKRVVGLPGDVVEYRAHVLTINGEVVRHEELEPYYEPSRMQTFHQYREALGASGHLAIEAEGEGVSAHVAMQHTNPSACVYSDGGVRCTVPAGSYFMMGDNRDNSEDSRFWGFVPERNIVGHAIFIWMNFGNVHRIGSFH
jgi:signal peptidase I